MTAPFSIPAPPWPMAVADAINRAAELRESWLSRPGNYAPPAGSPDEAKHEHHARWMASPEQAHAVQIIRNALETIHTPPQP